jgi:hypothetical protein
MPIESRTFHRSKVLAKFSRCPRPKLWRSKRVELPELTCNLPNPSPTSARRQRAWRSMSKPTRAKPPPHFLQHLQLPQLQIYKIYDDYEISNLHREFPEMEDGDPATDARTVLEVKLQARFSCLIINLSYAIRTSPLTETANEAALFGLHNGFGAAALYGRSIRYHPSTSMDGSDSRTVAQICRIMDLTNEVALKQRISPASATGCSAI